MTHKIETTDTTTQNRGGVKLFLLQVLIGCAAMWAWAPLAALVGITQPWVSIIFLIVWVIFWSIPVGRRADAALRRVVNGG